MRSIPTRPTGRRWLTGAAVAALVAPLLGGVAAPASAQSTVLLSVSDGDLSAATADVTHSGGQVLQVFEIADAMLVTLPAGNKVVGKGAYRLNKAGQGKAKVKIFGRYAKAIKRGKVKKVKVKLTSANGKTKAKILRVKR